MSPQHPIYPHVVDRVVSAVACLGHLRDEDIMDAIAQLHGVLRRRRKERESEQLAAQAVKAAAKLERRSGLRVIEGGAR